MTTVAFDTHKFVRRLREAGVPEDQAEAFTDVFKEMGEEADLATGQDIERLEGSVKQDMDKLEGSVKQDMEKLEGSLQQLESSVKQDMDKLEGSLKQDMERLETSLKAESRDSEVRLDRRIDAVCADLTLLKWMMGLVSGGIVMLIIRSFFPV